MIHLAATIFVTISVAYAMSWIFDEFPEILTVFGIVLLIVIVILMAFVFWLIFSAYWKHIVGYASVIIGISLIYKHHKSGKNKNIFETNNIRRNGSEDSEKKNHIRRIEGDSDGAPPQ